MAQKQHTTEQIIRKLREVDRNDKGKVTRRDHAIVTHLVVGCCN